MKAVVYEVVTELELHDHEENEDWPGKSRPSVLAVGGGLRMSTRLNVFGGAS
jgi:hypothetical protein